MWIRQIILDGFKSYAHRTVVGPFDREFNAITGLNGSGKSNVLDAICFVLAISNLSKVRVRDLRDLIYKSGQAGITKASVTIDFDNTDENARPIGYTTDTITVTRQIVIGGRNKFFINGKSVQLSQVQNLFHSVQLNVNNPHFLIMQGMITKVLGMKPVERLSMLEEAAGTRMFEVKKISAQNMVQKKEVKLAEIDRQLHEEMKPTLEKRENDRKDYDKYLQGKAEIERLSRMKLAYDYEHAKELLQKGAEDSARCARDEAAAREQKSELLETVQELTKEIETLKGKHAASLSSAVAGMQKEYDQANKSVVQKQAELKNLGDEVSRYRASLKKLRTEEKALKDSLGGHEGNVNRAKEELRGLDEQHAAIETQIEKLTQQLQLLKSGIAASAEGVSLTEHLGRLKKELIASEGSVKQADQIKQQLGPQIDEKRRQARNSDTEYTSLRRQLTKEEALLKDAEEKLRKQMGGYDPSKEQSLRDEIRAKGPRVSQLEQEVSQLETVTRSRMEVHYKPTASASLRGKVKGVVAKLIEVNDDRYTTAITQAAGGALYNVVVDSETTGKELLKEVQNRVTVIPLNKIVSNPCSESVCRKAKQVASAKGGSATLALELIGYPAEIESAVQFVFGRRFVCSDLDTASAVTFNKEIRTVSVTTDGEVVQPGGVMQGGSTRDLDKTLSLYRQYVEKRQHYLSEREELAHLEKELARLVTVGGKFQEEKADLEAQRRSIASLQYRLQTNQQHQTEEAIKRMEEKLKAAEEQREAGKRKAAELRESIKEVEAELKKGDSGEKKKKEVEQSIAASKKKLKELQPRRAELRRKVAEADATEQDMKDELRRVEGDCEEEEEKLKNQQENMKELAKTVSELEEVVKRKAKTLQEAKTRLEEANTEVISKQRELSSLRDRAGDLDAEIEKLAIKARDLAKTTEDRNRRLRDLENTDFVKQNKENFGRSGSDLDWRSIDHVKEFARLDLLKAQTAKMAKSVNHKVMTMYESVESQYHDVLKKRDQVARDKDSMLSTIEELEQQKKKTIIETYEKVSKDFSNIFATLLPGANAQLVAEYKDEAMAGLQIRVAMGKSWKDGLTELSGGQRSLLALSFILSLLKYKPAPVYILDEVDAALDLSHTQNIGKMLSNHFRNSQFLVVSLKEGMFNNANVLFRVRLADGQSQVARYDNTKTRKEEGRDKAIKRPRDATALAP